MLSRTRATGLLLPLSLGSLLLTGLAPLPTVVAPTTVAVPSASEQVSGVTDEVVMLAHKRRHTRIEAVRDRWEHQGGADAIYVDVNPTLPGQKFYRVVVKVKHDGRWTRCAPEPHYTHRNRVGRTYNVMSAEHARGRAPHELTVFQACKHKGNSKYRVIVPAQHGFARTVVHPHNP
jgi:hypothetical protein